MNPLKVVVGFVPFVAFSVLTLFMAAGWAAAVAVAIAIVVVIATAKGGVKMVPMAQAAVLLAMAILGMTGGAPVDALLVKYGPATAGLLLGLFMISTASAVPFTAQLARDEVPAKVSRSREFFRVNQRLSVAWGVAVLVLGLCHLAAAEIRPEGLMLVVRLAINWVLPLGAFWMAAKYTQRVAAGAAEKLPRHQAAGNAA